MRSGNGSTGEGLCIGELPRKLTGPYLVRSFKTIGRPSLND